MPNGFPCSWKKLVGLVVKTLRMQTEHLGGIHAERAVHKDGHRAEAVRPVGELDEVRKPASWVRPTENAGMITLPPRSSAVLSRVAQFLRGVLGIGHVRVPPYVLSIWRKSTRIHRLRGRAEWFGGNGRHRR
jgi:hypothetical protein